MARTPVLIPLPDIPDGLSRRLLAWYRAGHRDLPWRHSLDPYAIWISEVMLQQTTVVAVIPYYERFLARFPTVAALAEAPLPDVLSRWSGLGYYSRARHLKAAAEKIAREHAGQVPRTYRALRELPGIGDYTAGAILSIAYGVAEPVLDGNVARVLTRLFAIGGDPRGVSVKRGLRELAARLVPADAPGDFNQALMELGATVCTPKSPTCGGCPLAADCQARDSGRVEEFPEKVARPRPVPMRLGAALLAVDGAYLMIRRTARLMQGLFEFPGGELPLAGPAGPPLAERIARELDLPLSIGPEVSRIRHTIMNRKIELVAHTALAAPPALARAEALVAQGAAAWVPPERIDAYGVSSMALKVLGQIARKPTARAGKSGRAARRS